METVNNYINIRIKNKDPTDPEVFRPISLINQDVKIFMAIQAKRINIFYH